MGYWYPDSANPSYSHTAAYTYDAVNRLTGAVATPFGAGTVSYNLTFSYTQDGSNGQYGNMSCVTAGACTILSFNPANNQITTSGYNYDLAGNLTKDSSNSSAHTYQWDAEGRVSTVDPGSSPTWNFTYNALGHRAQWAYGSSGGAAQHLFGPDGTWLGVVGNYSLVTFGGRNLAMYQGGKTFFNHVNALGSTTMYTNPSGAETEDILFSPWGDVLRSQGSGGYNFAELPYYDTTTMTELTTARITSPNFGRWFSPDPRRLVKAPSRPTLSPRESV
jgi:YD repeat-containing protein